MKRFFRLIYYSGIAVLFLLVAIVGFTQTRTFRTYLHARLLDLAHQELNATVLLGSIQGNLLTGARIDTVALFDGDRQVLGVRRVELRYDPFGFLFRRLSFTRIKLVEPTLVIARSRDGIWNFDRMIRPSDDTLSSEWVYDLQNIEIENGTITVADSLSMDRQLSPGAINYGNVTFSSLQLAAGIRMAEHQYALDLRRFGFIVEEPEFTVLQMSGRFVLSPTEASIARLQVRTPGSSLRLDARMSGVDLVHTETLEDLETASIRLDLDAQRIDFYELRQLVSPWIDFLERDASLTLKANGTFEKLAIDECSLTTARSSLAASGVLMNLHKPEDLYLDVTISKALIDPEDVLARLAGLNLPDLRFLERFELTGQFEGRPDLFTVKADGKFDAGNLSVSGRLNSQQSPITYEASVRAAGLNIGALIDNDDLASALNLTATINGSGTTLSDATALMRMQIDTSEFMNKPVLPSIIVADLANRTLRSRVSLQVVPTRIDASSELRFFRDSTNVLVQGRVNSLNLTDLTKDRQHESDLSFDFRYASNGLSLERHRTSLDINLLRSTFREHAFEGGAIALLADFVDPEQKRIRLTSPVADADVEGKFTLTSFLQNVTYAVDMVQQAIHHRVESLDTLRGFGVRSRKALQRPFIAQLPGEPDVIDTHVHINIRNLEPIGVFVNVPIAGGFQFDGDISGNVNALRLSGESAVRRFEYRDDGILVSLSDGALKFSLDHLTRVQTLDAVQLDFESTARRLDINDSHFADLDFRVKSDSSGNRFALALLVDSLVHLDMQGTSVFMLGSYVLRLPTIRASVQSLVYENSDTASIVVGRDGYRIDGLTLRREVEEIAAQGYFNPFGVSDLELRIGDFLLNDLRYSSRKTAMSDLADLGGIFNGRFLFRGSFDHPNMMLDASVEGLRFRQTVLGSVTAQLSYFEKVLKVNVEVRNRPELSATPDIVVAGTLPYDLALKGEKEENLAGEMNLAIRSKGLQMELLDPFLDGITNLTGLLVCDVKIGGTLKDPSYEGFLSIQSARFLFEPLNIQYILDGRIVPSGQRVALENVRIRNIESDRPDGQVVLSGTFTLRGLLLKEFDLNAKGQLLVMKETARRNDQSLYGNLTVATSASGLRWYGSLEHSLVSGIVFVRNASLTLPPARTSFIVPNRTVTVTFVNDTVAAVNEVSPSDVVLASTAPDINGNVSAGAPARGAGTRTEPVGARSFLERIDFDLSIETQGITQVRFVFNPLTNEELFADLRGRLAFSKVGDQKRLTGEVEVTDRSYYSFIQKFEAKGKLLFTGDPINPELDVVARYEGIYRPDTTAGLRSKQTETAREQRVAVILEITGARSEPKVKIGLERERDGRLVRVTEGDIESDAISFLISGTFRDELTQQQRSTLLGGNLLMGLTSSVLSGPLSEFLRREFGYIRSVDVLFYGGGFDQTPDIRVTGEVGDAVIRFGGRVFSDRLGPNVNIQLPMSSVLNSDRWRNLILELERRDELVETFDERRKANSARLVYRITF